MIDFQEDSASPYPTSNFYEVQRKAYQGSSGSGTLLLTSLNCYNQHFGSCVTTAVATPITQIDTYRQLPNGKTSAVQTNFSSTNGLPDDVSEFDFGVTLGSAPTGTPARETITRYASLGGGKIVDHPSQITVKNSTGATKAQTSYTYDEGSVTTTTGTPQLTTPPNGARGNATTVTSLTSGSSTISNHFTYYDTGNVNTATDINGAVATYHYGACGNSFPTEIDYPLGLTTYLTWDTNCAGGVVVASKDANQNSTTYTYDPSIWRVTGFSYADGGSTTTTYNFGTNSPWNIVTSSKKDSTTNVTSEAVLDGLGRTSQTQLTSDPSGTDYVDTVYDALGRVASVSNSYRSTNDPTYGITQYSYDALNRTTAITHPDNKQATMSYTGAATEVVDEGNNSGGSTHVTRVYQSDGLGRLTSVCEVSGATQLGTSGAPASCSQDITATGFLTSYTYDPLGGVASVSQGSLSNRTYSYDGLGRLTQEWNPESGTTSYTYDTATAGDLFQRTRPKPNQTGSQTVVTTYTFDSLHRMTGASYNDGSTPSVSLSYDQTSVNGLSLNNPKGHLTDAVAAGGSASTILSYDLVGRIAEEWQCTPLNCGSGSYSLTFGHDYLGDMTSLVNSEEGNITYTYSYDAAARFTKLQSSWSDSNHPGTLLTINSYNPVGEVQQATLGNWIVSNRGYDNRGRVTSLTDGSVYNFTLAYAPDSDILTGNDSVNGNWTYGYDDFNRVASSNKNSGQQTFSYAYDRYSNRWQQNAPQGGPAPQYSFNGNNQISGSGVAYDAAGNVTNDGLGNTYTYDAENRLIAMSGSNSASYVYDAFGNRVRSTVNSSSHDFIFNGTQAVDEVSASGWIWGHPGGMMGVTYTNSSTYFDHSDWTGTVRARSNVSGTSTETCTSLAFGDALTCAGTDYSPLHYTGQPLDSESNLHHFLARQLSTTQGRWIHPDPSGMSAVDPTNPQTWNRYAYVANNPLTFTDPAGMNMDHGGCSNPDYYDNCGGGGGGGGGGGDGGGDFCDASGDCGSATGVYGISGLGAIPWDFGPGYNMQTTSPLYQLQLGVSRYLSIINTGKDPALGIQYYEYSFTGGDGSTLEQQKELAAIQLGQAACAGQNPSAVASCIQQAYNTMSVATNLDGSLMLVGGNYNFNYSTVSINGEGIDPTQLGCATIGDQTRCGVFDSLHFHDDTGTFHVDTGSAWAFPFGTIAHLGWDYIGGNTVWKQGGIPRPWWQ